MQLTALAELAAAAAERASRWPASSASGNSTACLRLNAGTLEPRPETELLVDLALERVAAAAAPALLDLGTGTGCIPSRSWPTGRTRRRWRVDSQRRGAGAGRARMPSGMASSRLRFDARRGLAGSSRCAARASASISSSPTRPISRPRSSTRSQPEVRDFDPRLALDGGPDGLDAYRVIAARPARWLGAGWTLCWSRSALIRARRSATLFARAGFADVECTRISRGLIVWCRRTILEGTSTRPVGPTYFLLGKAGRTR